MKSNSLLTRLIKLGLNHKFWFFNCMLISLLLSYISTYRPLFVGHVIDGFILGKSINDLNWFLQICHHFLHISTAEGILLISCIFILLLILAESFLQYYMVITSNQLAQNVIFRLRDILYKKLVRYKSSFFDKTPIGILVTRTVSDIETISTFYNDGVLLIFGDILRIVFILIVMFSENWKLALVSFFIIPLMVVITRYFQKALKKAFTDERNHQANLNSFVQERLSGMLLVQLFNRYSSEERKFYLHNKDLNDANLRTVFYFSLFFPVVEVIAAVAMGFIIYLGGKEALQHGTITIGQIISFIFYVFMLVRPLRQIADRFNTIQRGFVGAERVLKLIDEEQAIPNEGILIKEKLEGNINFSNVSFSYVKDEMVLKNISFKVDKGQKIAIVGATGSGKSTIINLLSRFYEHQSGDIQIDNVSIEKYELNYLRSQVAVVLQDVFLFNETIYENIVLGSNNISKEKVLQAADEIGILSFIQQLPNGLDFVISERGSSMSSGQKQLLSFLRAYLINPSILVLDEATSSIDSNSEELIQKALDKLTQGRTSIIIAHRLSTIQNADVILVMKDGEIMEMGNHESLLKSHGIYKDLYEIQFNPDYAVELRK